jgi:CRISPR-associated protein Cas1
VAAWKTIRITKPCKLSIESGNLIVKDDTHKFKLSLSDTDSIVFEGDKFTLTAPVLGALAKHKIATLFCDEYYMPLAILLPYKQTALGVDVLKAQIFWSDEFKASLWQLIIESKILNQTEVLNYYGYDSNYMERYIGLVQLNDKHNFEAKSARHYWKELFTGLKREQESMDVRNQALNYAYAICRSMLSRDLSAAGFNCALGVWHDNKFNPYNLADDLIEPFRPIIDMAVKKILEGRGEEYISPELKRFLINLFDEEYVLYNDTLSSIRKVTKQYVVDFKRAMMTETLIKVNFPVVSSEKFDECF